ncbi:MAG: hypothetical protein WD341_09875, partial [Tistlia sp.]|uniref:hypothetical protein n=1 Tax=Tistlia sp. TaxID=3057121 RepID=UPI0034A11E22
MSADAGAQGVTRAKMSRSLPVGLLLLGLLAVGSALLGGAATVLVALERAEAQFDSVLDEKALSRALRVQRDLQLALELGIPLAEIRGMWEYTAEIPRDDPDIRFVAVTGPALERLHYGGIGRERLDPLLADPQIRTAADTSLGRAVAPADAVTVGGFSVVTVPLENGTPAGFVHVGVQHKQLRERLYAQAGRTLPLTALVLLLVLELAGFAYAAGYREPLERLRALLESATRSEGGQFELSGRHAGGELGAAMFRFNALMHRLALRAGRFLGHADEVRRAVFEPAVAAQVAALAERCELGADPGTGPRLLRRSDPRPSDLRPALVLGLAAAVGVSASAGLAEAVWLGAAGLGGILVALLLLPVGLALSTAPLLVALAGVAALGLPDLPPDLPPALPLAAAGGLLAGLAARYAQQQELRLTPPWLALRLATG